MENILDWIEVGKLSAERDDNLSSYFYDAGVLNNVIKSPTSFLVLGRKGAGKTAVFKYLSENKDQFIEPDDILIPLSFEDYNWNIHSLLKDSDKAVSLAYKQSWLLVMLIESVKAYSNWFIEKGKKVPKEISNCNKLLEKLFDSPIPSIGKIVSRKILSLSKLSLPKAGLDMEEGNFDSIDFGGGEVSFNEVKQEKTLQTHLSENIHNLIDYLESSLEKVSAECPTVYICFDKVDEAWDAASFSASKPVITGLIASSDSLTTTKKNKIRPIVFLREDIFDVLDLNDSNKLREDCGELLHWNARSLHSLILIRIKHFAKKHNIEIPQTLDDLFDRKEMRQRTKPFKYLLKRTMMRPRDLISMTSKVIKNMIDKVEDPFSEEELHYEKLEAASIYEAEPIYSDWLRKEVLEEWQVQMPIIEDLFNAIQNFGSTNFNRKELYTELEKLVPDVTEEGVKEYLRFLFNNSIIGFKLGNSKEWKFKCFYPSQGYLDSSEYRVHEGLVRALNLRESREKDNN